MSLSTEQTTIAFSTHGNAKKYSEKTRLEVVNLFIAFGGNRTKVALHLNIPYETLKGWEKTEWFKEAYVIIKQQENLVVSAKLHKIIMKTLGQIDERVEFGDYVFDQKNGKLLRKPVGARDLHYIMSDSIDKKLRLERPQTQEQDTINVMDKLTALAANFTALALAQQSKPVIEVTDVVFSTETPFVTESIKEE